MNLASGARWLKRNGIVCLLLAAIVAALRWDPHSVEPPASAAAEPAPEEAQNALKQILADTLYQQHVQDRERATAGGAIEEHLNALSGDLEPEAQATRLCALGNLYQQKTGDYARAARYYELVIEEHPDWPGVQTAYHQLMACYKLLGDDQSLRLLYRRMVEVFPEGSPEYAYAEAMLSS